ncbi:MAG: hypothetical protein IJV63_07280, partial [Bacteroidales bacterium]|nr:hypothetical protein [Bacteroidales bacterium]
AIRDEVFGLTTREAAFTLVPALDSIDLGTDPRAVSFSLFFEADTVSCADDSQAHIIQNIYVTELTAPLPKAGENTQNTQNIAHSDQLITNGPVAYNGSTNLSFNFTQEFADRYLDMLIDLGPTYIRHDVTNADLYLDKYDEMMDMMPGIYLSTDVPEGLGGRINLFHFSSLSVSNNYYVRNSNVGKLVVNSEWDGERKDSTFLIYPGEPELYDEVEYIDNNTKFYQYCFNRTTQSTIPGAVTDKIYVEGGGGLKPVVRAQELQELTRLAVLAEGGDPDKAVIVKATIEFPFEMPEDYTQLKYYPSVLSPTIQTKTQTEDGTYITSFAGLTDASVSAENQGNIDRSNLMYAPDVTYHVQELLSREDLDTATNADIWFLTIFTEQVAQASGSLMDNEYYRNLMYASYYNSIYGGGYGYGSSMYGGGYGYNNYYSYMMMAQMMAASSQQSYTVNTELDKDRFYRAILCGYEDQRPPIFRVTFAIPEEK